MPFSLSIIFIPFRGKLLVFINYFKNYQNYNRRDENQIRTVIRIRGNLGTVLSGDILPRSTRIMALHSKIGSYSKKT